MQAYWKLIGAVVGNVVAIALVYLSTKGLATCDPAGNCTIMGFSTAQITGAATTILSGLAVHYFPANQPPAPPQANLADPKAS